jgi:hypothetical protein
MSTPTPHDSVACSSLPIPNDSWVFPSHDETASPNRRIYKPSPSISLEYTNATGITLPEAAEKYHDNRGRRTSMRGGRGRSRNARTATSAFSKYVAMEQSEKKNYVLNAMGIGRGELRPFMESNEAVDGVEQLEENGFSDWQGLDEGGDGAVSGRGSGKTWPAYLVVPGVFAGLPEGDGSASSADIEFGSGAEGIEVGETDTKRRIFRHEPKPLAGLDDLSELHGSTGGELVRGSTAALIMQLHETDQTPVDILTKLQRYCPQEMRQHTTTAAGAWTPSSVSAVVRYCEAAGLTGETPFQPVAATPTIEEAEEELEPAWLADHQYEEELAVDRVVDERVAGSKEVVEGWWTSLEDEDNRDWNTWRLPSIGAVGGPLRLDDSSDEEGGDDED